MLLGRPRVRRICGGADVPRPALVLFPLSLSGPAQHQHARFTQNNAYRNTRAQMELAKQRVPGAWSAAAQGCATWGPARAVNGAGRGHVPRSGHHRGGGPRRDRPGVTPPAVITSYSDKASCRSDVEALDGP